MSVSLGMESGFLILHLRNQFLDPINGKLVTDFGSYPFVVLDPFVEFLALLTRLRICAGYSA